MTNSRCTLHFKHLPEFIAFCEQLGWTMEPTKDPFEKLRMRHPLSKDPLFLHSRIAAKEHLTSWGISDQLVRKFMRGRK